MKKSKKEPSRKAPIQGYNNFDELTRKLVSVPKEELEKEIQTYEKNKAKKNSNG